MRPARAVSFTIWPRYFLTSGTRAAGSPSSLMIRWTSIPRFRTPESGLLISCATLADSCPSDARRSVCRSFWWATFSSSVRSATLVSSVWVNWACSSSDSWSRTRIVLNDRASSPSSPWPISATGRSRCIFPTSRVPLSSRSTGLEKKVRVKKMMNAAIRTLWMIPAPIARSSRSRTSRSTGPRSSATSRTPRTFWVRGWAWHSAWLQEGSL